MTTIVMTGGTSGLGAVAASRLAAIPGIRLILGARGANRSGPPGAQVLPLDLARLDSVREFAASVGASTGAADTTASGDSGSGGIDALVLNAGVSFSTIDQRTSDGFETTFAVNHLAHYLLARLLLAHLNPGAVIVLTTSGTHDPAEGTLLPAPRHANAKLLAAPELDPELDASPRTAGGRAYSASKLCNVLTAKALAARPEAREQHLSVVAYDPGPTPGTGLSRNSSPLVRGLWRLLGSPLGRVLPRLSSRAAAGRALADLALGTTRPPSAGAYGRLSRGTLSWIEPSELARDEQARNALWTDSATLVGLES